ncbi:MAG: porphobilinogen synthase [Candidatus Syntropharchaeia archaeon]
MFPKTRMRRLRRNERIREMMREVSITPRNLIYPMFIDENIKERMEIESMPGQFRIPLHEVVDEVKEVKNLEIPAVLLFGIPSRKDGMGSGAYDRNGVIQKAVREIKDEFEDGVIVITDVCLCEYTDHGHCGIVEDEKILNDPTLDLLRKTAVSHAEAGSDIVAPSGMMDGAVGAIRKALDEEGFFDTLIMSYAAKYASSFYSPFRDAADSGYTFGDRSTYQMQPANSDEALREVALDIEEGADIIMIKPALGYLDVLYRVKREFRIPTAAYNVSGEYSMIKSAGASGFLDEESVVREVLYCIRRAGADLIVTYFAKEFAGKIK